MQVEQAVFTSLRSSRLQGYHLAARSPGIDSQLAADLTQWGPSHDSLSDSRLEADSLNFHPLGDGRFVLSRSVRGEPEYSGRGGLQIVTVMLVLRQEHVEAFEADALALARTARAGGLLRYVRDLPESLPTAEVPDSSTYRWRKPDFPAHPDERTVVQAARLLDNGERVALCGRLDREEVLARLIARSSPEARFQLSFTTGLKPSLHRDFRLHFLPESGSKLHQDWLLSHGIRCVTVT